jgi:hypothetical protein
MTVSLPVISPAYKQIEQWYQKAEAVSDAKPQELLVTTGAPDEGADEPKETDPSPTVLDVFV